MIGTGGASGTRREALIAGMTPADWLAAWRQVRLPPTKRRGLKKRRQDWAKVKHDPSCGAPTMRPANSTELAAFKRLAAARVS